MSLDSSNVHVLSMVCDGQRRNRKLSRGVASCRATIPMGDEFTITPPQADHLTCYGRVLRYARCFDSLRMSGTIRKARSGELVGKRPRVVCEQFLAAAQAPTTSTVEMVVASTRSWPARRGRVRCLGSASFAHALPSRLTCNQVPAPEATSRGAYSGDCTGVASSAFVWTMAGAIRPSADTMRKMGGWARVRCPRSNTPGEVFQIKCAPKSQCWLKTPRAAE